MGGKKVSLIYQNGSQSSIANRSLILISILTTLLFGACQSTPNLTEYEVYNIINEIIADDSLFINKVCWEFRDVQLTEEYKQEFTQDDISFIDRQRELFKNLKVKPNRLKWYIRSTKSFQFTTVYTECNKGSLYHISFPLISVDRQKVLIEFQDDCNCMLGGQGGKDLYEKKNGKWVRTKGFDHWISDNKKWKNKKQLFDIADLH
jgi:hypothetical protein